MGNSIISTNTAPPTPPTPQQMLQRRAKMLAQQQQAAFGQVIAAETQTSQFIWRTPAKAQAAFDAFAAAGFTPADLIANQLAFTVLVMALDGNVVFNPDGSATVTGTPPASPMPDGYRLQVNGDGSVTVLELEESDSVSESA